MILMVWGQTLCQAMGQTMGQGSGGTPQAQTFKIIGKLEKPLEKLEIIGKNWKKLENLRFFQFSIDFQSFG